MNSQAKSNTFRMTAIVVGLMYVAGFVVGMGGNGIVQSILGAPNYLATISAHSTMLAIGAILWLIAVVGDAGHGVLMFPILKQHSERIAVGYLAFRIIDAAFIAISVLFILLQIPLGSEYLKAVVPNTVYLETLGSLSNQANLYAYELGMIALGISGLMLNFIFFKANLVPRLVAVWGLVGYAIIFLGMSSELMGSGLGLASSIPGGLWEVFIGVWLITKGFNTSAFFPAATKTERATDTLVSQPIPTN